MGPLRFRRHFEKNCQPPTKSLPDFKPFVPKATEASNEPIVLLHDNEDNEDQDVKPSAPPMKPSSLDGHTEVVSTQEDEDEFQELLSKRQEVSAAINFEGRGGLRLLSLLAPLRQQQQQRVL